MKISFLVTYYQQEKYVQESLDSILSLKKPPEWEILIGDDGSTDGTAAAAQSYVDRDPEHIRLYIMDRDPNRKYNAVERASANRMNLVRHATGDCYCLMDGDDFYSEADFVPEALSILESRPEVSVVGFGTWIYQDGSPVRKQPGRRAAPVPVHRKKYLRWKYTHAGACVIRKASAKEELAVPERLGIFDDNGVTLNALSRGKLYLSARPVYAYRQAGNSVYTEMDPAERAALNLMGLGVCLQMMGPAWEKDVLARFASAVWMAWFLRKNLPERMNQFKYQTYLDGCRRAEFCQGEKLLRWPELNEAERKKVRRWVWEAGRQSPPRILYAWLQTHGRRAKA